MYFLVISYVNTMYLDPLPYPFSFQKTFLPYILLLTTSSRPPPPIPPPHLHPPPSNNLLSPISALCIYVPTVGHRTEES